MDEPLPLPVECNLQFFTKNLPETTYNGVQFESTGLAWHLYRELNLPFSQNGGEAAFEFL
jgi:hypothetical protein